MFFINYMYYMYGGIIFLIGLYDLSRLSIVYIYILECVCVVKGGGGLANSLCST